MAIKVIAQRREVKLGKNPDTTSPDRDSDKPGNSKLYAMM